MIVVFLTYILAVLGIGASKHFHICGRSNHNGSNGELLPHNGIIPSGHDCNWHIYPESFNIPEVYMVVEDFRLDAKDKFTVSKHDGDRLFGPISGTKETFTILTGTLMLDVSLTTSDSSHEDRHFKLFYTTNDCYYLIEEESGTMTSPLYNYVASRKITTCTWQFRKFKQVTLPRTVIFETFHLMNSTLTVKGSKAQDGIYSGTKLPGNIIAFGETQFIFHFNASVSGESFSFRYGLNVNAPSTEKQLIGIAYGTQQSPLQNPLLTNSQHACGNINLRALSGYFAPKNETMIADHTCIWSIQSQLHEDSEGIYIVIEESHLISDDTFVLHQLAETVLFGPYYGKEGCFSIFTDENRVEAILKTSSTDLLTKRHFRGYYSTADCTYSIINNAGVLHSPFYKTKEQKKTACSWIFNQPDTTSILSVSFDNYNIKSSQLQIKGSINQDQIYEGSDGPFDILMKVNGELTLEIDRSTENESLSFSYNTVTPACSDYIKIIEKESTHLSFPPPGSNNIDLFNCQWILEGSNKKGVLAVYFDDIHLADAEDLLLIKDGKARTSPRLVQITENSQDNIKGSYVVSNTNVIWISFSTRFPFKGSQFKISVNISEQGGHLHNEQNFTIQPESDIDVIFYLEVERDEQVLLSLLPEQNLPSSGVIMVYNGFTVKTALLSNIKHDKTFYPVASTGSKMMLVAKGFHKNSSVKLNFKGIKKGCHQVTLDQHGTYSLSGYCNDTCSWVVLPNSSDDQELLSLHLSSVALMPDDIIEVKQLDDRMTPIANITLKENIMPNVYLPASKGAYVRITRGTCINTSRESTAFFASAEILRDCSASIDVDAGEKIYLTSPNYPDTYPFNSHCQWKVSSKAKNLYISFEKFQLANGHCLRIHETDNGHTSDSITYNSSVVPHDGMFKNNIIVELIASHCTTHENITTPTSSGNGFSIEIFALDCGGTLGKEMKGSFSTPSFPKAVEERLLCIWYVVVPFQNDDGSINVISFDIQWSSASTDEETGLTIHDGPTLSSEIITNSSTTELLSKTNSVIFIYEKKNVSKAQTALQVNFESRAGNSLCDNGIYMHPDWVCNGINDCGDYSDEKNCKGRAPLPPPVPPLPPNVIITKSGVSKTVFWSVVPSVFIVGILSTFLTAFIVKEVKRRRESMYDTLPILP